MPDKTTKTLQWAALVATLVIAIASPIIAVTKVNTSNEYIADAAKEAKDIAATNRVKIQENAEDLEYFKGKIEGTLLGMQNGMTAITNNQTATSVRLEGRIDKLEGKVDEMLQILVRFKRGVDNGK
jgi:TolA-binding protein